jgi:hypothetical protein
MITYLITIGSRSHHFPPPRLMSYAGAATTIHDRRRINPSARSSREERLLTATRHSWRRRGQVQTGSHQQQELNRGRALTSLLFCFGGRRSITIPALFCCCCSASDTLMHFVNVTSKTTQKRPRRGNTASGSPDNDKMQRRCFSDTASKIH